MIYITLYDINRDLLYDLISMQLTMMAFLATKKFLSIFLSWSIWLFFFLKLLDELNLSMWNNFFSYLALFWDLYFINDYGFAQYCALSWEISHINHSGRST